MNQSKTVTFIKPVYRKYFELIEKPVITENGLLLTDKPLWRDISIYQKIWDAFVSRANGVYGAFIRSSYGFMKDENFPSNYKRAYNAGLYRSSYHALYPELSWVKQLDIWYSQHPAIDGIPRCLDVELKNGIDSHEIGWICHDISRTILSRDGVRPIIYSRANLINPWFEEWTPEALNEHYYWLAQYLFTGAEHPGPVTLPNRLTRERVLWHQTSSHKPDFPGEAESLSIDWDRWELGDFRQMLNWIAINWKRGIPEPLGNWFEDIDAWARSKGFASIYSPPGGTNG